jgi:hypothetical protein
VWKNGMVTSQAVKPFAALQVLGLCENKVQHAADVLTVASWEQIAELRLWGNPIVSQRSTLPPELAEELKRRMRRGQPVTFFDSDVPVCCPSPFFSFFFCFGSGTWWAPVAHCESMLHPSRFSYPAYLRVFVCLFVCLYVSCSSGWLVSSLDVAIAR